MPPSKKQKKAKKKEIKKAKQGLAGALQKQLENDIFQGYISELKTNKDYIKWGGIYGKASTVLSPSPPIQANPELAAVIEKFYKETAEKGQGKWNKTKIHTEIISQDSARVHIKKEGEYPYFFYLYDDESKSPNAQSGSEGPFAEPASDYLKHSQRHLDQYKERYAELLADTQNMETHLRDLIRTALHYLKWNRKNVHSFLWQEGELVSKMEDALRIPKRKMPRELSRD